MGVPSLPVVPAVRDCQLTFATQFGVTSTGSLICTAKPASRTAPYAETTSIPTTSGTTAWPGKDEPVTTKLTTPAIAVTAAIREVSRWPPRPSMCPDDRKSLHAPQGTTAGRFCARSSGRSRTPLRDARHWPCHLDFLARAAMLVHPSTSPGTRPVASRRSDWLKQTVLTELCRDRSPSDTRLPAACAGPGGRCRTPGRSSRWGDRVPARGSGAAVRDQCGCRPVGGPYRRA